MLCQTLVAGYKSPGVTCVFKARCLTSISRSCRILNYTDWDYTALPELPPSRGQDRSSPASVHVPAWKADSFDGLAGLKMAALNKCQSKIFVFCAGRLPCISPECQTVNKVTWEPTSAYMVAPKLFCTVFINAVIGLAVSLCQLLVHQNSKNPFKLPLGFFF